MHLAPCLSLLRIAGALSAGVAFLPAAPGCSSKSCFADVRASTITLQRDADVAYAELDRTAIDVCVAGTCARAGDRDAQGFYQWNVAGGRAKLKLGAEDGGRTQAVLELTLSVSPGPVEIRLVLHDTAGVAHPYAGTVVFDETDDGCYSLADRTTI
jgi:hypothetical protein